MDAQPRLCTSEITNTKEGENSGQVEEHLSNRLNSCASGASSVHCTLSSVEWQPSSIFFAHPVCHHWPAGRWQHAAVGIGSLMLVFGGVDNLVSDDLLAFDAATLCWRVVSAHARTAKDRPAKVHGLAAAAFGNR